MKTSIPTPGRPLEGAPAAPGDLARRRFMAVCATTAAAAVVAALRPTTVLGYGSNLPDPGPTVKRFIFAQVRYTGGNWDPHPTAPAEFLRTLESLTSVEAQPQRVVLVAADPGLFSHPFLYISGQQGFTPWSPAEVERLRSWIEAGGTLLADDAAGTPGYGFDTAFRRELARVLPTTRLERLAADHTVFKSFFLLRTVAGSKTVSPFLEGATIQGRTAVIYTQNDLFGAMAIDPLGRLIDPCAPGGERQRRSAIQLAVNIVMYALCNDYKQDRVHLPFLRQRI